MRYVQFKLGALTFSAAVALVMSAPATALCYNIGMFWKGSAALTQRKIAVGRFFSCAVISDGTAKCWGGNNFGQLGDGTTTQRSMPSTVMNISGAVSISGGFNHACVLISDGTVKCWGNGGSGALGNGATTNSSVPVTVSGLSGATSISVHKSFACSIIAAGSAMCWGYNAYGQLGDGTITSRTTPVSVNGLSGLPTAIAAGGSHACAALSDGSVNCWGDNLYGQLGDGNGPTDSSTPVTVLSVSTAISIAAGVNHNCALLVDGTAKCWGRNEHGQLGNGTTMNSSTPVVVSGLGGAISITASEYHSCAMLSNGNTMCWGGNTYGQLGDGASPTDSLTPVAVSGVIRGTVMAEGGAAWHSCAAIADGTVKCWGYNGSGGLGDGTMTDKLTPIAVTGFSIEGAYTTFKDSLVMSAGGTHSCTLLTHGIVKCWGDNYNGQLGDGTTTNSAIPVTVSGSTGVTAVSAGGGHSCALLSNGTVQCWGNNLSGQLGDGTTTSRTVPVTVSGLIGAIAISAGGEHSCALLRDGSVMCWGNNGKGPLGDGTNTHRSTPVEVIGLSGVISLSAGRAHSCAVLSDGSARCWGDNEAGQLGDGTNDSSNVPVSVADIRYGTSISVGSESSCVLDANGTIQCWGKNDYGQLGDGTTTSRTSPQSVANIFNVVSISSGGSFSCARVADVTVQCLGVGSSDQLGYDVYADSSIPVTVPGLSGVISLGAGDSHSCVALVDGTGKCWGNNTSGQAGNASTTRTSTPVPVTLSKKIYSAGSSATSNGAGTTSLILAKPSGTSVDRVMVAGVTTRPSTTTITTPSGWTLIQSFAIGNVRQSTYYRVATAADVSVNNYTWMLSVSAQATGVISTYANVDPSAPILTSDGQANSSSVTMTAPSLTTTEGEFHSVAFFGSASNAMVTTYTPTYTYINQYPSTNTRTFAIDRGWTSPGATGALTATLATAAENVGQQILLKKAP